MITSPVGAELSPPTRGAHRSPIGQGSLPRKRAGFAAASLSFRSSPPDLSRHSLVGLLCSSLPRLFFLSLSLPCAPSPQSYVVLAAVRCPSLSGSRLHSWPLSLSIYFTSRLTTFFVVSHVLPLSFPLCPFSYFPVSLSKRTPPVARPCFALNVGAEALPCPKDDHSFRAAPPTCPPWARGNDGGGGGGRKAERERERRKWR